jgi:Fur family ferric uptake transcriptional regulator
MHIAPDALVDALRDQGLRITAARRAICAVIASRHGQHLTAATILADVLSDTGKRVDQSTVYRTLDALETGGHLVHCHLGHGPAVYHLPSEAAHIHVVCDECGAIASVSVASLGGWIETVRSATGFEVDPTHMGVTGRCAACAATDSK